MRKFAYGTALGYRLASGDNINKTARWFMKHAVRKALQNATPAEQKFWMRIVNKHLRSVNW
jgi:hypothetical protein